MSIASRVRVEYDDFYNSWMVYREANHIATEQRKSDAVKEARQIAKDDAKRLDRPHVLRVENKEGTRLTEETRYD